MIPDLGKYAMPVLGSYVASVLLIVALVGLTLWKGRRVKRALSEAEARLEKGKTNG